jgi:hypothetical protein
MPAIFGADMCRVQRNRRLPPKRRATKKKE